MDSSLAWADGREWRTNDVDAELAGGCDEGRVVWARRRCGWIERGHAELGERPLDTSGGCDCEKLRVARRDQVCMRDTARKRESVPGCKLMHVITDDDGDVAVKHDELLVLALVHVQRKAASAWLFGLPDPKSTLALDGLHVHDDRASKPQTRLFSRTRRHHAIDDAGADRSVEDGCP